MSKGPGPMAALEGNASLCWIAWLLSSPQLESKVAMVDPSQQSNAPLIGCKLVASEDSSSPFLLEQFPPLPTPLPQ